MIETLGSTAQMESGAMPNDYDFKLAGIGFKDGDLCQPRYGALFDYERAPKSLLFEPSVRIREDGHVLRFLLRLEEGGGVNFKPEHPGVPVVISLPYPNATTLEIPGLVEAKRTDDGLACELTWDQSKAEGRRVTSLRLPCVRSGDLTREETVYGGVYLSIVNHPETRCDHDHGISKPHDPKKEDTIRFLGTDRCGRSVYDLFRRDALEHLPAWLSLEPAFRVREKEFPLPALAVEIVGPPGIEMRFTPDPSRPEGVDVQGLKPEGWPSQLVSAERLDDGSRCGLTWLPLQGSREAGQVNTFLLEVFRKEDVVSLCRHHVDPTVIQPPSCTGGICV